MKIPADKCLPNSLPLGFMRKSCILVLFICYAMVSFGQTHNDNDTKYYEVKRAKEDSTFSALKDTAQKHLPEFIDSVQRNGVNTQNYRFTIKTDFVEKGHHEHLWSQILAFENGYFVGIFIDAPFTIKNIKFGDSVRIAKKDVEDWEMENLKTQKQIGYFSEKIENQR